MSHLNFYLVNRVFILLLVKLWHSSGMGVIWGSYIVNEWKVVFANEILSLLFLLKCMTFDLTICVFP